MAVDGVGNMLYIHQNMHLQAGKQTEVQNRFDMQNLAAMEILKDEDNEVQEVRPTEESYKIDPEHEHEKEKSDEESGAKEEQIKQRQKIKQDDDDSTPSEHILDIIV